MSTVAPIGRRVPNPALIIPGILLAIMCSLIYMSLAGPYIVPGVRVAAFLLDGRTRQEAESALGEFIEKEVAAPLVLTDGARKWKVDPRGDLGLKVDIQATLFRAHLVGRRGTVIRRLFERFQAARRGYTVEPCLTFDEAKFWRLAGRISTSVNRNPQSALVFYGEDGLLRATGSRPGKKVMVRQLAKRVRRAVTTSATRTVELPVKILEPHLTAEGFASLGIKKRLAAYSTRFAVTDRERVANIELAAQAISGYTLAPGEVFSFNAVVGPRDDESGYLKAPVVISNRLAEDIGGGVCQVSSTLYNAALLAGLEVVSRFNHSILPAYIAPGRDATVAFDYLDLRFRNTTPGYLLIFITAKGGVLTAELFGTGHPGRHISIRTEIIRRIEPDVVERVDDALAPGERVVDEKGSFGYDVKVWRDISIDGRLISRELVSVDHYRAKPTVVRVGVSKTAAPLSPPVVEDAVEAVED